MTATTEDTSGAAVRAVRSTERGIEVLDLPEPPAGEDSVRVRVRGCGICGSDLGLTAMGVLAATLGHEFAGWLDDGTPVAVEPLRPCGQCAQCRAGAYNRCALGFGAYYGIGIDGGMADSVHVAERTLVPLPSGLAVDDACLVEPFAVAVHGLRLGGIKPDDRVAVVGGGTVGLCAAAVAKAMGATVDVRARHPHQQAAARALGASTEVSGEYDLTVEGAGTAAAVAEACELAGFGATVAILGVHSESLTMPGLPALIKELKVVSSLAYNTSGGQRDIDVAAQILADDPTIGSTMITHRVPLERAAEGFRLAADRSAGVIKVVLEP